MSAIRGAQIRPSAKQAVVEAEQEMHEERLDMINARVEAAEKVLYDEEDFDWSLISFDPNFYRTNTEQEAAHKKYSNHGPLSEEPLRFERKLRRLRRQFTHICRSSLPTVDTQFDDTPIFIQLFRESDLPIQTHLLALRSDRVRRTLIEDEEFQDFHSGIGVDGYSIETSTLPRVSSEFDWMFNPRDHLD